MILQRIEKLHGETRRGHRQGRPRICPRIRLPGGRSRSEIGRNTSEPSPGPLQADRDLEADDILVQDIVADQFEAFGLDNR